MAIWAPAVLVVLRAAQGGCSLDGGYPPQRMEYGTSGPVIWKGRRYFQVYQNTIPTEVSGPSHGEISATAR